MIFLEPLANFTETKETKISWHFAIGEVQKDVNVMDLVKSLPTSNTEKMMMVTNGKMTTPIGPDIMKPGSVMLSCCQAAARGPHRSGGQAPEVAGGAEE